MCNKAEGVDSIFVTGKHVEVVLGKKGVGSEGVILITR